MRARKRLSLFLAVILALSLAGCASSGSAGAGGPGSSPAPWEGEDLFPDEGQYTMEIGHIQPLDNPRHLSLLKFQADVEAATCGHVRVVVHGDGELGPEEELLQQVMAGGLQGMRGGQYYYSPRMAMFTLPFLTQTRAQVTALLHSDLAQEICQEAGETTGTIVLDLCDSGGYRELSNAQRPVRVPEDLRGLTIRTNGLSTTDMFFQAMGAETVTIPYASLYTALSGGLADGQDNPWINAFERKLYEVQPYFTQLDYQFHPDPFFVNAEWFNALPQAFQDILTQCAADMGDYNDQLIDENTQAAREAIDASDAEVYTPTPEELEAWREAAEPVYEQCIQQGICTAEEVARMRQIVAQAQ